MQLLDTAEQETPDPKALDETPRHALATASDEPPQSQEPKEDLGALEQLEEVNQRESDGEEEVEPTLPPSLRKKPFPAVGADADRANPAEDDDRIDAFLQGLQEE